MRILYVVNKIWLLGGWFYLSLIIAILASLILRNKSRRKVSLVISFFVVIITLFSNITWVQNWIKESPLFFTSVNEKMDKDTFGQYFFAKEVRKRLPQHASGCIYVSWDTSIAYLIQELYPFYFITVPDDTLYPNCKYVISQFKARSQLTKYLIYQSKNNYLYRIP